MRSLLVFLAIGFAAACAVSDAPLLSAEDVCDFAVQRAASWIATVTAIGPNQAVGATPDSSSSD